MGMCTCLPWPGLQEGDLKCEDQEWPVCNSASIKEVMPPNGRILFTFVATQGLNTLRHQMATRGMLTHHPVLPDSR